MVNFHETWIKLDIEERERENLRTVGIIKYPLHL